MFFTKNFCRQLRFGLEVLSRIFLRLLHIENNNMQLVLHNPEKFFSIIDGVARLLARILAQIERRTKEIEAVEQQQQHCRNFFLFFPTLMDKEGFR